MATQTKGDGQDRPLHYNCVADPKLTTCHFQLATFQNAIRTDAINEIPAAI